VLICPIVVFSGRLNSPAMPVIVSGVLAHTTVLRICCF
jgi:hypothetical protein